MADPVVAAPQVTEHAPIVIEGVSVFIGIVAGAIVQYLLDVIRTRFARARHLRTVRFELTYVQSRVSDWKKLARALRDAINADNPGGMTQYFDLSKVPLAASWALVNNGEAFKTLDEEEVRKLLEILSSLNQAAESVHNTNIQQARNNFLKQNALMHVQLMDNKLDELEANARAILKATA